MNFRPLTAETCWRVWAPHQISTGAKFGCIPLSDVAAVTKPRRDFLWPSPGLVYYIYIFRGSCPVTEFCHVQNSVCVQVLRSPILAALLHGTQSVGVSESLRRRTRNGISELSQRAPPVFGWEAITLGIGPHSSYIYIFSFLETKKPSVT